MRRWEDGHSGTCSGISYRVVQGRKSPDDLCVELWLDGRWVPVRMNLGLLLADFFAENEDVLYPPELGFRGGRKYLDALRLAARDGWVAAWQVLQQEKEERRARRVSALRTF